MKKITLITIAVLSLVLALTGCAVQENILPDEDILTAETRAGVKSSPDKKDIRAEVTLFQVPPGEVVDDPKGSSFHTKVLEEHLMSLGSAFFDNAPLGSVDAPEWDLIAGTQVEMTNETNYNLDAAYLMDEDGNYILDNDENPIPAASFNLWGSNHSIINFKNGDGDIVLTLSFANGTVTGNLFSGAEIEMNWVVADGPAKGTGKITGTFIWFPTDFPKALETEIRYAMTGYGYSEEKINATIAELTLSPRGNFVMTGTITEK